MHGHVLLVTALAGRLAGGGGRKKDRRTGGPSPVTTVETGSVPGRRGLRDILRDVVRPRLHASTGMNDRRARQARRRPPAAGLVLGIVLGVGATPAAPVMAAPAPSNAAVEAFRRAEFRIVAKQEELPPEVRTAVASYLQNDSLADPGRKWNATDAAADPKLPRRRLALAGSGKTSAFVAYEHGGVGKHLHLLLLALDGGKATVSYACTGLPVVPLNLDGLRVAVRTKACAPLTTLDQEREAEAAEQKE